MNPKKKKPLPENQPENPPSPEGEIGPSEKTQETPKEKKKNKDWVDKIRWFGE